MMIGPRHTHFFALPVVAFARFENEAVVFEHTSQLLPRNWAKFLHRTDLEPGTTLKPGCT